MAPEELRRALQKSPPAPVYLFLGPEMQERAACRKLLIETALPPEDRQDGFHRVDLDEVDLHEVMDNARSFSLFSPNRLIWVSAAESALPRGRAIKDKAEDDEAPIKGDGSALIAAYVKNPTPGVVLVFDCSRFDFDGDDKTKLQRVQKFYAAIREQVEFPRLTPVSARRFTAARAKALNLILGEDAIDMLVEALCADASRIDTELEKLRLYAGDGGAVTLETIRDLVPSAKASTIFALVNAIGRRDRVAALDALDILVRDGEYLPLALTFLAAQFRLAAAAREAGLKDAGQIQTHFTKHGTPMWRARAEQVQQTMRAFSADKLQQALISIFETDRGLRDARPDDRTVMERFIFGLT